MGFLRAIFYLLPVALEILCFVLLQVILLPISLLSSQLVRSINDYCVKIIVQGFVYLLETIDQPKIIITGDTLKYGESALVIANHQSYTDSLVISGIALRYGMLAHTKYFAKESLKWIPILGWGIWAMGNIFVKRNWQKDEKNIQKMFEELKTYRYPIWLISYPEGSRVTPKKIEMSQQFAKERNLPLLNTVLIPRTKGFVATVNALRNTHIKYVYDLTIYYEPVIPTVHDIFAHKLNDTKLIIHIKRYEISTLPSDESKLSQWLYERFQEKDMLIERLKKGDIPPQNNETPPLRVHIVVVHFLAAFVIALFAFLLCFIFI